MKAIFRKSNCLAAIEEMPKEIINDAKWNEMGGNDIVDLYLALADEVLSSVEEKKTAKKYRILS